MLIEIIKGVSMKLNATFGEGYKIYQNDVRQGLKQPCFFLSVLKPELTSLLMPRYLSRNPLDVQYIPTDNGNNAEMYAVADTLMEVLEFIKLPNGDVLHGTTLNFEVVDGVLHFYVNYNLTLIKLVEKTNMDRASVNVGTKKG